MYPGPLAIFVAGAIAMGYLVIALLTVLGLTGDTQPNTFGYILGIINLLVAIWIIVDLGILRGSVGPNEYGPDPVTATM